MTLFDNIQKFGKSFHSIRKHEEYFILDLNISSSWVYDGLYNKDKIAVKVNKTALESTLLSFYCLDNPADVVFLENEVTRLIQHNNDEEEKTKLLNEKRKELELLFNSKKLEDLKSINFTLNDGIPKFTKKILSNGEEPRERNTLVGESSVEGPKGDEKVKK
jgi:hypothetical protein